MAYRALLQLLLFTLPFLVFFIYTLISAEYRKKGLKTWPINMLFLSGAGLFIAGWLIMIALDQTKGKECIEPPRMENGVLIASKRVDCASDLGTVGQPLTNDPGSVADGVGPAGIPASATRAAREVEKVSDQADSAQSADGTDGN